MTLSLDHFSLLVTIADEGSFTAAAKVLRKPKSTVTRHLASLESQLQTSLFHRSTRALSLTDEGQRIYGIVKPVIEKAQNAARIIADSRRVIAGRITLTTTTAIGTYLVAPNLSMIAKTHPHLQIDLQLTEIRLNIIRNAIDLAIRIGTLDNSELVARRIASAHRLLVVAPTYIAKYNIPHHPSELESHNAIITNKTHTKWQFKDGLEYQVRWRISAGNMLAAHQLALAGSGIALLPYFLIHEDLIAGRLIPILDDYFDGDIDVWIVSSRQRYRSPAVRMLVDTLTRLIPPLISKRTDLIP